MNFNLKGLLFFSVLFLSLIYIPAQVFGMDNDLSEGDFEAEFDVLNTPRDWETDVVDSEAGASASMALSNSGQPGISYIGDIDSSAIPPTAQLKYAKLSGSMWQPDQAIPVAASNTDNSLQIDSSGKPHISYYAHLGKALRYIVFENGVWKNSTVASNSQKDTGIYNSLQLTSGGKPRIAYWDAVNGRVMYARYTGTEWKRSKIFEMTCVEPFPPIVSLALDSKNEPHVSFYDCEASNLKYAYQDSSGWHPPDTIDSSFRSGLSSSIAIDSKNNPHISYRSGQGAAGRLMYTFFNGSKWEFIQVDPDFWYGEHSSLALDEKDRPHIGYTALPGAPTHEMRVAFYDGYGWFRESVDTATNGADYTAVSLQVDQNDHTHVAYIDNGSDQLKYAHRDIYRRYVYMPVITNKD
jgi:hypothetical protein